MDIYIPAFLMALVIAGKARKEKVHNSKRACLYVIIAGIPFILVSGLRYNVGTDYGIYKDIFNSVRQGGTLPVTVSVIEKGYLCLNRVVAHFSSNYQSIMIVAAVITITCYYIAIFLLSTDIMISVFLWFLSLCFFESMNTVRQSLAVALFFISIHFIYRKKWWWYFLFVLIAVHFHRSAAILFVVYWIVNRKCNVKWHIGMLVGVVAFSPFLNILILHLPLPERYLKYFVQITEFTDFRFMDCVISVLVWMIGWYFHRFVKLEKMRKYSLFINLQFLAVLIAVVSGSVPMAYRILQYFVYIPVLMIPEILNASHSIYNKQTIKIIVILFYTMQWAYYVICVGIVDFVKYTSVFSR